jgi:hypothetical protein
MLLVQYLSQAALASGHHQHKIVTVHRPCRRGKEMLRVPLTQLEGDLQLAIPCWPSGRASRHRLDRDLDTVAAAPEAYRAEASIAETNRENLILMAIAGPKCTVVHQRSLSTQVRGCDLGCPPFRLRSPEAMTDAVSWLL